MEIYYGKHGRILRALVTIVVKQGFRAIARLLFLFLSDLTGGKKVEEEKFTWKVFSKVFDASFVRESRTGNVEFYLLSSWSR